MQVAVPVKGKVKVADEVWIATALLHKEHPARRDFSIDEIVGRVKRERLGKFGRSAYVHAVQHCVANRVPNSGRYRMLFETAPGRRRLFRVGDIYHPAREGSKIVPEREDVPSRYAPLLTWYHAWGEGSLEERIKNDPLLVLYGDGKDIWADEHADDYVRRIREGWE